MQRETKSFTTKLGHIVVIKTYLTGREANSVKEEMYGAMKMDVNSLNTGSPIKSELSGAFIIQQERKLLSIIVDSIDGVTENILEKILDLRNEDYQEIVAEVNKVYSGNLAPAK